MASKLSVTFNTADGEKTFSWSNIDPESTTANVRNFINAVVTNGIIFENQPTSAKTAKIITTTETDVELED